MTIASFITVQSPQFLGQDRIVIQEDIPTEGEAATGGAKDSKDKTKKPKKKKGLKGLKDKLNDLMPVSAESKYIHSLDFEKVVTEYSKQMDERQKNYTITAKDKADLATVEAFRKKGKDYIKKYNDSLYNTPEYVKIREHRARLAAAGHNGQVGANKVTVVNNSSSQIILCASAGPVITKINGGDSKEVYCDQDIYLGYMKGNTVKRGDNKIYTKNTKCDGGTITVN